MKNIVSCARNLKPLITTPINVKNNAKLTVMPQEQLINKTSTKDVIDIRNTNNKYDGYSNYSGNEEHAKFNFSRLLLGGVVGYLAYKALNDNVETATSRSKIASKDDVIRYAEKEQKKLQNLINNKDLRELVASVKDKDVVIFLGNTRCGKSTLVNQYLDSLLDKDKRNCKGKKDDDGRSWLIECRKVDDNGKKIGPDTSDLTESHTEIPSGWSYKTVIPKWYWWDSFKEEILVDMPGFDDTRGEGQDVANAFCIKEIITNAKTVKIIFVVEKKDIESKNVNDIVKLFATVSDMIPNLGELKTGCAIVLSKLDEEFQTPDIVATTLQKKLLNAQHQRLNENEGARELIRHFVDNKNLIGLVPRPTSETLSVYIKNLKLIDVEPIPNHSLKDARLPERCQIVAGLSVKHIIQNPAVFEDVLSNIKQNFAERIDRVSTTSESEKIAYEIQHVASSRDIKTMLDNFKKSNDRIRSLIDESRIDVLFEYVKFVDEKLSLDGACYRELNKVFATRTEGIMKEIGYLEKIARVKIDSHISRKEKDAKIEELNKGYREICAKNNTKIENENKGIGQLIGRFLDQVWERWAK